MFYGLLIKVPIHKKKKKNVGKTRSYMGEIHDVVMLLFAVDVVGTILFLGLWASRCFLIGEALSSLSHYSNTPLGLRMLSGMAFT